MMETAKGFLQGRRLGGAVVGAIRTLVDWLDGAWGRRAVRLA